MWIMTIRADGSVCIASCQSGLMNTIQYLLILFIMTFLTGGIHFERKITGTAGSYFGMGKISDIRMAIYTSDIFSAMYRGSEFRGINGQWERLASNLCGHSLLLMTDQTLFIRW